MQSQINNNTPVHIKAALNGEFRRFLLNPPTFAKLEASVIALFGLSNSVTLKFQDDEKDWVLLTNDTELLYAIDLAGSPLRIDVTVRDSVLPVEPANEPETPQPSDIGAGCWKSRRGKGGCEWKAKCNERLEAKEVRIAGKIADLEEKLKSGALTSERERTVRWRHARLQEKLAFITAKRQGLAEAKSQKPAEETTEEKEEIPQVKCGRGRGGRGRGCRGPRNCEGRVPPCQLRKMLPPELMENFHQTKAAFMSAKEGGDKEEIEACKEAFLKAKQAKLAALQALRAGCETTTA
jgi:hypothetical protein